MISHMMSHDLTCYSQWCRLYQCPLCYRSMTDMTKKWEQMDKDREEWQMPFHLRNFLVKVYTTTIIKFPRTTRLVKSHYMFCNSHLLPKALLCYLQGLPKAINTPHGFQLSKNCLFTERLCPTGKSLNLIPRHPHSGIHKVVQVGRAWYFLTREHHQG